MSECTHKSDGSFSDQTPHGGDIVHHPFLNLNNLDNYLIERVVFQDLAAHSTPAMGTAAGSEHGGDSAAGHSLYLIDESPLDRGLALSRNAKARCTRLWAPEWSDITEYTSINFPLPDLRGLAVTNLEETYQSTLRRLELKINLGAVSYTYVAGATQTITLVDHKLETGDVVELYHSGDTWERVITVVDDDTFEFPRVGDGLVIVEGTEISYCYVYFYWYVRSRNIPARVVHQFYMPGVTEGITTPADIPKVAAVDHDAALAEAVVARTDEIIIEASELTHPYPGVYARQIVKISTRDLYDKV